MADRPLAALTAAFAAGILAAAWGTASLIIGLILFLPVAALFAVTRRPFWSGTAVLLACALLGSARTLTAGLIASDDVSRFAPAVATLTGVVQSESNGAESHVSFGRRTASFTLAAQEVTDGTGYFNVSGNVAVRVPLSENEPDTNVVGNQTNTAPPHYGDKVTIRGVLALPSGPRNPGGFDYRAYLRRRGIHATLTVRRPEDWRILQTGESRAGMSPIFLLRRAILRRANQALPPLHAAVLNGILLGERGDLPGALKDDLERTGTVHILATAGLHVGVVVALLLGLLRLLRISRRPARVIAILVLMLYAVMAGGRPSVVRAVIVAIVFLAGILLEREPDLPNALALAALFLLVFDPSNLFDAGFQLSFATVITIVLLMPFAEGFLRRIRKRLRSDRPGMRFVRRVAVGVSVCFFLAVAAQIGAAPLVAYYFNDVSFVSILANTLIVPVLALVIALGFSVAPLGFVSPFLSLPLDYPLNALLAYTISIVQRCSALSFAAVPIASPPVPLIAAYYALVWGLAWRYRPGIKRQVEEEPEPSLQAS